MPGEGPPSANAVLVSRDTWERGPGSPSGPLKNVPVLADATWGLSPLSLYLTIT